MSIRTLFEAEVFGKTIILLVDEPADGPKPYIIKVNGAFGSNMSRSSAEFALGKAIFAAAENIGALEPGYFDSIDKQILSDALKPYVDHINKRLADGEPHSILLSTPSACACMGPRCGEPLCPCRMSATAKRIVAEELGYKLPT